MDVFPLVLIWSVITLYFHDLADVLKTSPYILIHICVIVASTLDIGNLQLKIDSIREARVRYNSEIREREAD